MNLVRIAIRRPVLVTVFFLAVAVLGIFSLSRMQVDLVPRINIPIVTIMTLYPGSGPDQVETLVTKPVEDALSTTNSIKNIFSTSAEGISVVIGEFNMDISSEVAAADVREKVSAMRSQLPEDSKDPEVLKLDINAMPVIYLGLSGPDAKTLYQLADNYVRVSLQSINGIGKMDIVGGLKREIRIEAFPDKLKYYGMDLVKLAQRIGQENTNLPSGHYVQTDREVSGRLNAEFKSISDISSLDIPVFDMMSGEIRKVSLASVAGIKDTYAEVRDKAKISGEEAVGIIIQKQPAANTVEVVDGVEKILPAIQKNLPAGVRISVVADMSTFIRESVADVKSNLFEGVLITALVLFLFLHSVGSTLIVSVAIPVSLIGTFFFAYLSKFTLNVLSLSGIALTVGIVVDSSIVVIENIYRHRHELGKDLIAAAEDGTDEVKGAIMASMLTNIVVFIPIVFMAGIVGQFFKQFGMVQVYATLISMLVSFTLIPMLTVKFLKGKVEARWSQRWEENFVRFRESYKKTLARVLARPAFMLVCTGVLFLASFALMPIIGMEMAPTPDQGMFNISVRMAPGTNLGRTEQVIQQIEDKLKELPEYERTFTTIGSASSGVISAGSTGSEYGQIVVTLKEKKKRRTSQVIQELKPFLASLPGASITAMEQGIIGGGEPPFEIYLTGHKWEDVAPFSRQVLDIVENTPGISDSDSSYHAGKPEINFAVRRSRLAEFDLSPSYVALNCRAALEGLVPTKLKEGENTYDIRVTLPERLKNQRGVLENLPVTNSMNKLYFLKQVADLEESTGPTLKERYNRKPSIKVTADLNKPIGTVMKTFQGKIKEVSFPEGTGVVISGEAERMGETFRDLLTALAMASLLVYLVMAAQFENWVEPLIIIGILPLATIGIFFGIFMLGKTINIFSLMGMVILTGIGVNNGILIIDFAKVSIQKGREPLSAIIEASALRLRPILMTSLTVVSAMIPLAFGMGKASAMKSPIGVTVIFGALSTTLLTLFINPLLYYLYTRKKQKPGDNIISG